MAQNFKGHIGCLNLNVSDADKKLAFPLFVMYPAAEPSGSMSLGPFTIDAKLNAPVSPGQHPLVVISHGSGGTNMGFLGIAQNLADNGYIVAMPEHFGNNRTSNELEGSTANLQYRPRHISLTIDEIIATLKLDGSIDEARIAVIGHSMGGYTALAVAGATPWSQMRDQVVVPHDSRVKAIGLLAPATDFFIPAGSMENVAVPIFLRTGDQDYVTPPINGERVLQQVKDADKVDFKLVENAGHWSFMSPMPQAMKSPQFLPSTDPEGFDRAHYHQTFNRELRAFLSNAL